MENKRPIIQYLPDFVQGYKEIKEITKTEQIDLDDLWDKLEQILKNNFIMDADIIGIERYEKALNIAPIGSISQRKFEILAKLNNQLPYTVRWLENKLKTLVGEGNYKIKLDSNDYKITVEIAYLFDGIASVMNKDLRQQLPANLIIIVNLFQTEELKLYFAGFVHTCDKIIIRQVM